MTPPTDATLGLGLAAIGRPAYITTGRAEDLGGDRSVEALRQRTHRLLDEAVAAGVPYLDAARSYGRSEEFLSEWLHEHPDVHVEIGSKWGYRYVGGWRMDADVHEVKDHALTALEEQWEQTSELLGDWLDVYHVHSATLETGVLEDRAVHEALARLQERGLRIGISTSGSRQSDAIRKALEVTVDGLPLFTSFQTTWNVLEPSAGDALREAADAGARVIVKEPVANGLLTAAGVQELRGADSPLASAVAAFSRTAQSLDLAVDQLAIAVALAQPWASIVLSGAVTVDQLHSNLAARAVVVPGELLDAVEEWAQPAQDYWQARSRRPWS